MPSEKQKFCQKCGSPIARSEPNCSNCGARAGWDTPTKVIVVLAVAGGLLFVSLPIIGIVAAIAIPNFISAQQRAYSNVVKGNMRQTQIAVESYAQDHEQTYPSTVDDFKSYFPGGVPNQKDGQAPINPCTKKPEWPIMGSLTSVQQARTLPPEMLGKGVVEYSVIVSDGKANAYAIRGGDGRGMTLRAYENTSLVLSNQD